MKHERSQIIDFLRGELIGPARTIGNLNPDDIVVFDAKNHFFYPSEKPVGVPVFWKPTPEMSLQEVIHYTNETPINRYGAGLLFPKNIPVGIAGNPENNANNPGEETNPLGGYEITETSTLVIDEQGDFNAQNDTENGNENADDDFEVASPDIYEPSTMGITFCIEGDSGELIVRLPTEKLFFWQPENDLAFVVNGRYEQCIKVIKNESTEAQYPAWRRVPATGNNSIVRINVSGMQSGKKLQKTVPVPEGSLDLVIEIFPRKYDGKWFITIVLRNHHDGAMLQSKVERAKHVLYQSFFEVSLSGDIAFSRYPEGVRPFNQLDRDEQSLALLYRDAATWAVGHGCAAGWDTGLNENPQLLYADVMPTVELPSMTPDITDDQGKPVTLSMRDLANLPQYTESNAAWQALENLARLYKNWISIQKNKITALDKRFDNVANRHMTGCEQCLLRITEGIQILKDNPDARKAFALANQSMLLQQISSKQLAKRMLHWNGGYVAPVDPDKGSPRSPWEIYITEMEKGVGSWRAFQIAFLLMSIGGLVDEIKSNDRDIVDLIWFPTGGGKTEAYLGVAAFYMFHQRLITKPNDNLKRDGTNVFMRYTLRMLTTQQFQRAASLICSMEFLRSIDSDALGGTPFSLGLWIGGDGSPNDCEKAKSKIRKYANGDHSVKGNPLVITECPWCKSEIGKLEHDPRANRRNQRSWKELCLAGFHDQEPILRCSDTECHFGGEYNKLPVEVIDERIYQNPPSMFIGTADKFAMLAYKPEAGSLFGRNHNVRSPHEISQTHRPPGLIIQDEFHLISGSLGTIYGLYEGVIERLCSVNDDEGNLIKPKIVASTATIKGAEEQVKSVYAREQLQLFPSPGLLMGDSFFGRYATVSASNKLDSGRLYLGIHAHGYGSFLTAQVRAFTAVLFRAWFFDDAKKDAWWTLLAFYNSLRELGGARTLFTSDISSRLKNYSYRYGCEKNKQRHLNSIEELTSRRSQAELVQMMGNLSLEWNERNHIDVCLASSIIEVGVDIDRLSLMAVVGQPKSTAQYIQVTGRVGRKWGERPGLILAMYNPAKSRDRSHFEQFQSYHRRLYERVEPTSATPFSVEAVERAMAGALLLWARQFYNSTQPGGYLGNFQSHLDAGRKLLADRCVTVLGQSAESERVLASIQFVYERLLSKWQKNPQAWWQFPQKNDGEYLMLWAGQYATSAQQQKGETVLSSMRNVDGNAYMTITDCYV